MDAIQYDIVRVVEDLKPEKIVHYSVHMGKVFLRCGHVGAQEVPKREQIYGHIHRKLL
jgi:hypothetical protein